MFKEKVHRCPLYEGLREEYSKILLLFAHRFVPSPDSISETVNLWNGFSHNETVVNSKV